MIVNTYTWFDDGWIRDGQNSGVATFRATVVLMVFREPWARSDPLPGGSSHTADMPVAVTLHDYPR